MKKGSVAHGSPSAGAVGTVGNSGSGRSRSMSHTRVAPVKKSGSNAEFERPKASSTTLRQPWQADTGLDSEHVGDAGNNCDGLSSSAVAGAAVELVQTTTAATDESAE